MDSVVPRGDSDLLWILLVCFWGLALFFVLAGYVRSQLLLELRTHTDLRLSFGFLSIW